MPAWKRSACSLSAWLGLFVATASATSPPALFLNEWLMNAGSNLEGFVEIYNAGATDVDLSGFYLTDDLNLRTRYRIPSGTTISPGGFLAFDSAQTGFSPSANGNALGLSSGAGAWIDAVIFELQTAGISQGRCPDGAAVIHAISLPTPGAANLSGDPGLVEMTNQWQYRADGLDLGTVWKELNYDDANWAAGSALFSYGNPSLPAPIHTQLPFGPTTYYFRAWFTNACPFATNTLFLSTVVDDGAVFYLNGVEVLRLGMPSGSISYGTPANRTVNSAALEGPFNIAAWPLTIGWNLLAVEVHQAQSNSNTVAFGLTLGSTNALPLVVTMPLSEQTIPVGETVRFTVEASGEGPLAFQWYKDGLAIPGATNSDLTLFQVQSGDAAVYGVVVTDLFGSTVGSEARLDVLNGPRITESPQSQTVAPGTPSVTFTVDATGQPPLVYQWRRNGFALPGATNVFYTIPNVRPEDGGLYAVVVGNLEGEVLSDPAALVVAVSLASGSDFFGQSVLLSNDVLRASNVGASRESGEPLHAGKLGGQSVWYDWVAPSSGIASFDTRGSTFDTLLAVYTGASLSNLTLVAADEDQGGFYTSEVRFNALGGTLYHVAIDGHAGEEGTFILRHELEVNAGTVPVILSPPATARVARGSNAVFAVDASGAGLTYQWFFNGQAISGATQSTFQQPDVQSRHVGFYAVRVGNADGQSVTSAPFFLEIGPADFFRCADKFHDLLPGHTSSSTAGSWTGVGGTIPDASGLGGGFLPPSTNAVVELDVSTAGSSISDPMFCSVPKVDTWHELPLAPSDGVYTVVASGEKERPALTVFEGVGLVSVACAEVADALSLPRPNVNIICFQAAAGAPYYLNVNSSQGQRIRFELQLGVPLFVERSHGSALPPDVTVYWCAQPGAYGLDWTNRLPLNPVAWPPYPGPISILGKLHTAVMPGTGPTRFFRLRRIP
jgi:Lamin Tail Domain/Immunoglobulin domain/Immunoglobulin I-set domain